MSGHHPFTELTKDFPANRRRRIDGMKKKLLAEMPRAGNDTNHTPREGNPEDEQAP